MVGLGGRIYCMWLTKVGIGGRVLCVVGLGGRVLCVVVLGGCAYIPCAVGLGGCVLYAVGCGHGSEQLGVCGVSQDELEEGLEIRHTAESSESACVCEGGGQAESEPACVRGRAGRE